MSSFKQTNLQMAELKDVYSNQTKSFSPYDSNNQYLNFPPIMNDGRSLVASFQFQNDDYEKYKKSAGFSSNWKYRQYLTENAKTIMKEQLEQSFNDVGYYQRHNEPPATTVRKPSDYVSRRV